MGGLGVNGLNLASKKIVEFNYLSRPKIGIRLGTCDRYVDVHVCRSSHILVKHVLCILVNMINRRQFGLVPKPLDLQFGGTTEFKSTFLTT